MDILIEIIIQRIIIRAFGVYTRYIFFYLTGKKKSINSLKGINKKPQEEHSQDFWNAFVGLITFTIFSFCLAYLIFS